MSTTSSSESARDLLEAFNAAKMMKEEEDSADMVADLLVRAGRSLIKAVKAGDIGECRELLAIEGVDIHIEDREGYYPHYSMTPVLWACKRGYLDIVEYLVSKGANVNDKEDYGINCLMWACCHGHLNIVEYLVSKEANIDDKDEYGYSCLMSACYHGKLDIVEYLVSKGASIYEMTNHGDTCFSYARNNSSIRVLYRLRKWPTTMAILVLQELALIYIIDSESVIDLHQYLGRPDDCTKTDKEKEYSIDEEGNVLDPHEDSEEDDEDDDDNYDEDEI